MTPVVAVVGVLLLAITVAVVAHFRDKIAMASRRSRLSSRRKLDLEDWYREQFLPLEVERKLVIEVLTRLAQRLGCDVTQIHADDSFSEELSLQAFWPTQVEGDDQLTCFREVDLSEMLGAEEDLQSLAECATVGEMLRRVQSLQERGRGHRGET